MLKKQKWLLVMEMLKALQKKTSFFFFLLFAEKVHLAVPFSASFPSVVCIKDGVVSHVN